MVDERARIGVADPPDAIERTGENRAGILRRDVSAREHEGAHFCRLQGEAFELAVANTLVASQNNPAVRTCLREPNVVSDASGKVFGVSLDDCARIAQRGYDRDAVQRLVEK